uniref:PIN domain-containing protein n=1 Tax=Candidatus Kentrum sp. MB TaxID=2138164 RepID=A0A450Y0M6_9GAMM|nr:MAG: hypothetical protein BECKMB1821I_GA0114274_11003 [Candidatus Kentron sp. MB]VFK77083.1 MAG: hypothetical protein BECKMB1821H_GA0114242_10983 [Candidatus Kentron sp. MB]
MNRFIGIGLKPIDSLHIACAIALQCDYFITVDKGILKKSRDIRSPNIISPIDFIIQWESGL